MAATAPLPKRSKSVMNRENHPMDDLLQRLASLESEVTALRSQRAAAERRQRFCRRALAALTLLGLIAVLPRVGGAQDPLTDMPFRPSVFQAQFPRDLFVLWDDVAAYKLLVADRLAADKARIDSLEAKVTVLEGKVGQKLDNV